MSFCRDEIVRSLLCDRGTHSVASHTFTWKGHGSITSKQWKLLVRMKVTRQEVANLSLSRSNPKHPKAVFCSAIFASATKEAYTCTSPFGAWPFPLDFCTNFAQKSAGCMLRSPSFSLDSGCTYLITFNLI